MKIVKRFSKHSPILTLLFVLIAGIGIFSLEYYTTQREITIRNNKEKELEMTKLPKEIKKQVEQVQPLKTTVRIPILVYHYVEIVQDKNDKTRKSLSIPPSIFTTQIETLKTAGYTFLTASDVGEILNGKMKSPPKAVVLSFDDGYRDFYTDVFPILKKENVKAVAYIVPGFLDKTNYLYSWQLDEIIKSPLVEIGAHTMHHIYLKGASFATAEKEIVESKQMLEDLAHKPVVSFAYPYGAFDTQAADIVESAGFTNAVSTIGGNDVSQTNRFFLYRIHPGYGTGPGLISTIERDFPKHT